MTVNAKKLKENMDALHKCPVHRFEKFKSDLPAPYRLEIHGLCANCGGYMQIDRLEEYVRGFMAAGGNFRTVLPSGSIGVDFKEEVK